MPPRLDPMSVAARPVGRQMRAVELVEHPGQRERREIRLVEVRATECQAVLAETAGRDTTPWSICADDAKPWR